MFQKILDLKISSHILHFLTIFPGDSSYFGENLRQFLLFLLFSLSFLFLLAPEKKRKEREDLSILLHTKEFLNVAGLHLTAPRSRTVQDCVVQVGL